MLAGILRYTEYPSSALNALPPLKGQSIFFFNISIDVTILYCHLKSLSTVDVWSANLFCSIEGFFFIALLPAKAFFSPRYSRGFSLVQPKDTKRRQLDALLDGMSDTGIRIVTATAKEISEVEKEGE